jgi:signal peptidase I
MRHMESFHRELEFEATGPFPALAEPTARAQPKDHSGLRTALREIFETILLTLLIFLLVRTVVQNFKVEGSSMEPNLHSGQYLLVNKLAYLQIDPKSIEERVPIVKAPFTQPIDIFGEPHRGDVVVFRFPKDPSRDFIKRVIGVPGDTVEVRERQVLVNGRVLDEPYLRDQDQPRYPAPPIVVPPGQFYVLGDNRNNSSDSHVWGLVPRDNVIGRAWLSYWPQSEWGWAPNYELTFR